MLQPKAYSLATQSTLGTGGSSDNPLKVAGTTAKFSEPTSRVEDDPPRISGSYAGLTYTNKPIEEMEYDVVKDRASEFCLPLVLGFSDMGGR